MEFAESNRMILFAPDVASECGIALSTARRWLSEGRLGKTVKLGRRRGVRRERFEKFLKDSEERFR